jgi:hypothetical protein
MFGRPPLNIHSIAAAPDLEANHAWIIKPLRDLLGSRNLIKLSSKGPGPPMTAIALIGREDTAN